MVGMPSYPIYYFSEVHGIDMLINKDTVIFLWYFVTYTVHWLVLAYLFLPTTLCVRANPLLIKTEMGVWRELSVIQEETGPVSLCNPVPVLSEKKKTKQFLFKEYLLKTNVHFLAFGKYRPLLRNLDPAYTQFGVLILPNWSSSELKSICFF